MSITSGYIKSKQYRTLADLTHKLVSYWTHSSTVEYDNTSSGLSATDAQDAIDALFNQLYGLCTKTVTIGENSSGYKQITEYDTGESITAVTTIVPTSSTVKTITTVITPANGDYYYTKTTVITTTSSGKTITESYTQTAQ